MFITVNNARNILGVHAIMMFIAWGVLVYIGIGFAKLKVFLSPLYICFRLISLPFAHIFGFC